MSDVMLIEIVGRYRARPGSRIVARPGERIDVEFEVANTSSRTQAVFPRLIGVPPGWIADVLAPIEVDPGAKVAGRVRLLVAPEQPYGICRLGLVDEAIAGAQASSTTIEIEVEPTTDVDLRVEPRVAVGGRGTFVLSVSNGPSRPLSLEITGVEHAHECEVRVFPAVLELPPGGHDRTEVLVGGRRPWFGTAIPRPIEITATDRSGERWTIDAQLRQSPRIPRWLILAIVVAILLAVWIVIMATVITIVRKDPIDPYDQPPAAVTATMTVDRQTGSGA